MAIRPMPAGFSSAIRVGLVLAIIVTAACWLRTEGGEPRLAGGAAAKQLPDDGLPLGVECTLHVARGGAQEALTGTIQKANAEWIVLESRSESAAMAGVPIHNKIPYISRNFKNVGVDARTRAMWIPRENVLYVLIERPAEKKELATEEADR